MDWVIFWAKQVVHAAENTTESSNATRNCQLTVLLCSNGMGRSLSRQASKPSVFSINWAILGHPVPVLKLARKNSLSSTSQVLIISPSIIVNVATNPCQLGSSYSANDGFLQRFHLPNQRLASTASKHSRSSLYKAKRTCMTTTTPFSDCPTTRTCPHPS